jgi:hypothetical protein
MNAGNDENREAAQRPKIKSVFLSFHFEDDNQLVTDIRSRVERQGLEPVTGERLGGSEVPRTVKDRIRTADATIALLTRRYRLGDPKLKLWDTYPWVRDELNYAYQLDKPAIAIVETGVEIAGAFSTYERITFEREQWAVALKKLEETLLLWTGGLPAKPFRVQLLGDKLSKQLRQASQAHCRYRWWAPPSIPEEWTSAQILFITGGIYFFARRPPDESALIEVQILEGDKPQWDSPWTGLEVTLNLSRIDA